jgi:hypothetical protein
MKLKSISRQLLFVLFLFSLLSFNLCECGRSAAAFNTLATIIPPASTGLLVIDIRQVLKAPAARTWLASLEERLGFDPVRVFTSQVNEHLGITPGQLKQLAFFWLETGAAAGRNESSSAPGAANPAAVPAAEADNWDTGLLLQLDGMKTDRILTAIRQLPGIKEAVLTINNSGQAAPHSLTYFVDESFHISLCMHADYLFLASSTACLEQLLIRYQAAALSSRPAQQAFFKEAQRISFFTAPELWPALNHKPVKLLLKPAALNSLLRYMIEQTAEQAPLQAEGEPTHDESGLLLPFTLLPATATEIINMLGVGINLTATPDLDVCFLYEEKKEYSKTVNNSTAGVSAFNQAVLLNSLGWENYMSMQKVLSQPRFFFKQKSIQVQGNIKKELIPQVSQSLLAAMRLFFPYEFYFADAVD